MTLNDDKIILTKKEIDLLWMLASHPGQVFTRAYLLDQLWGFEYFGDHRTVDIHIRRLRSKLDIHPHPEWRSPLHFHSADCTNRHAYCKYRLPAYRTPSYYTSCWA